MIDFMPQLAVLLEAGELPVIFESFIDSSTPKKCVTYASLDNRDYMTGDSLKYSAVTFRIKVWGPKLPDVIIPAKLIDTALSQNGFRRTYGNIITSDGLLQNVLIYTALAYEHI